MSVKIKSLMGWAAPLLLLVLSTAATYDLRLVEAVKNQNKEAIRTLLRDHADVNARWGDGTTALHWSAHWDDLETADALLRAGANVNSATDIGVTPLSLACENANRAMVDKLLAAGADPNAALSTGESPLMTCSRTGSVDGVRALLARGGNANAKENSHDQTALIWAVSQKHPEVVQALIKAGADVGARTRVHREMIVRDVPNAKGEIRGHTSGEWTEEGGGTALQFAARVGDLDSAKLLVAAGAKVNDNAADGTSALLIAAYSGHSDIAEFLLDKDANPNAAGPGYTALHAAVLMGDLALVKALLAHGANPNALLTKGTPITRFGDDRSMPKALLGATPFWLAARFGEIEMMRALSGAGANPKLAIKDGTTPLMAAAGAGYNGRGVSVLGTVSRLDEPRALEAVRAALELGGDVNAADHTGDTVLHIAAAKGYNRVVELLVQKGANLDAKDNDGRTPLAFALNPRAESAYVKSQQMKTTVELLKKLGAKE
jgi:ankyrin repeat protein